MKKLLLFILAPLLAFGAAGDIKIDVKNASDNAWISTIFAKQNNAVLVTNASGVPGLSTAPTLTGITLSGLTSGRVTYATTGGTLTDNSAFTFNGTTLSINTSTASTGLGVGSVVSSGGASFSLGSYFGDYVTITNGTTGGLLKLTRDNGGNRGLIQMGRENSGTIQITAQILSSADTGAATNGVLKFSHSDSAGALITDVMTLSGAAIGSGKLAVNYTTASTLPTNGSATFLGGVGVAGSVQAGLNVRSYRSGVTTQYIQLDGGDAGHIGIDASGAGKALNITNTDTGGTANQIVFYGNGIESGRFEANQAGFTVVGVLKHSTGLAWGVTSTATAAGTTTLTGTSTSVQIFTGSTTQSITLPAANVRGSGYACVFTIKNRSSGSLTVNRAGSDTIDGGTSDTITTNASKTYISDGSTAWTVN